MGSLGLADFPCIYPNGDRNQYLQQSENALHEDRLSVREVPLSKTIRDHLKIRPPQVSECSQELAW
jgi:hypothetical protein